MCFLIGKYTYISIYLKKEKSWCMKRIFHRYNHIKTSRKDTEIIFLLSDDLINWTSSLAGLRISYKRISPTLLFSFTSFSWKEGDTCLRLRSGRKSNAAETQYCNTRAHAIPPGSFPLPRDRYVFLGSLFALSGGPPMSQIQP